MSNIDFTKYPSRVTLCFKNDKEKEEFLGQLSDGWGENLVNIGWSAGKNLFKQDLIVVEVEIESD